MDNLIIEATKDSPDIRFDQKNNLLEIKGESFPENAADFYSPVFLWLEKYIEQLTDQDVTVNIELIYFNSSSSKILLDFFDMLDEAADTGKKITINWIYDEDDDESLEFGEEFQEDFNSVRFNMIQKDAAGEQTNAF
ncbi:MAG: DUF1987 domain-containing protein [Desulfobacterales bacterium]|nr:DUF1987 domain-containing protein [Desulfobacterales bacterium]